MRRPPGAARPWPGWVLALGLAACGPGAPPPPPLERLEHPPALEEDGLEPAARALVLRRAAEVEAAPGRAEPWLALGSALHAHGRFQDARACYAQVVLRDPGNARAWYLRAVVEDELGAVDAAVGAFQEAVRLAPDAVPARWRLGNLWLGLGELGRARSAFEAALSRAPHDAAAVVGRARVLLQQEDFTAAASALQEHLRRLPVDGNARYLLALAYQRLGRSEDAAALLAGGAGGEPLRQDPWLQEVLALRQGDRAEFLRAVEELDHGDPDRARAQLEELHARRPEDTLVLLALQRALRRSGELERAIELLLEARRIDPLDDIVHVHLAGACREAAHRAGTPPDRTWLERALESATQACELSPTFAEAQAMRGDVLEDLGRPAEAAAAHRTAAELAPDVALWQEKAGVSLCRAGRWAEAVPVLRRLDALRPNDPRGLLTLAAALANSGQLEEARAPLAAARRLAPDDPAVRKASEDLERSLARVPPTGAAAR